MQLIWPLMGCGLGLRAPHYSTITSSWPAVDWFEAVTENYMDSGGRPLHVLEKVRTRYPVALHGTALSIGSTDSFHPRYLERWKALVKRIEPFIVSDHICWADVDGHVLHDLLPLPFTEESLDLLVRKTEQAQTWLGRRILLENVSTYVTFKHSTMPEWAFVRTLAERSGCGLLLDINNVYVNAVNHQFDAREYLENIPGKLVGQIHLAGHTNRGAFLFDTHSRPVIQEVWDLYAHALNLWGPKSTLIEWDEDIPEFSHLVEEAARARKIYDAACARHEPEKVISINTFSDMHCASSAPPLEELQYWFKSFMEPSEKVNAGAERLDILNPQGGEDGRKRFEVYRGGYFARTHESLREVYEAVAHVVGEEKFAVLSEAYAGTHVSRDYNLNLKAAQFPVFLERAKISVVFPYLPDLARLEWAIAEAFHAFDEPALTADAVSTFLPEDWEHLVFTFQPSMHVLALAWPVFEIWRAYKKKEKIKEMAQLPTPQRLLVARERSSQVFCDRLGEPECALLTVLRSGCVLGDALETVSETVDETAFSVQTWFSKWMQLGLITGCAMRKYSSVSMNEGA